MAGNISINNNFSEKSKPILNSVRVIKGFSGKTSITALSKDLIMQFPVLMSAGIDVDDAVVIAKGLEKMFADMFLAVWTADASQRMNAYTMNGVRDFVKRYHNNNDIPDVIAYGGDILSLTDTLLGLNAKESTIENVNIISTEKCLPAIESAKLWETTEDKISLESINDMYLPATASHKKIAEITDALEASKRVIAPDPGFSIDNTKNAMHSIGNASINPDIGKPGWDSKTNRGVTKDTNMSNSTNSASIVKNDKLSSLEPTLIDVTFLVHGHGAGGAEVVSNNGYTQSNPINVRQQRAIIGVKTMIRLITSKYMIPNVIASIQDESLAFKFVKWTKGEMKVGRDMLLGISRMKQDATASNQADIWFAALRKRKRSAKTFRFSNTGINPFATLVVTTDELEQIKAASGYDLMSVNVAKMLMDNLFLLGFVVVDTNTKLVHTIFDGSEAFSSTTIKAIKASNPKEDNAVVDALKAMRQLNARL